MCCRNEQTNEPHAPRLLHGCEGEMSAVNEGNSSCGKENVFRSVNEGMLFPEAEKIQAESPAIAPKKT